MSDLESRQRVRYGETVSTDSLCIDGGYGGLGPRGLLTRRGRVVQGGRKTGQI